MQKIIAVLVFASVVVAYAGDSAVQCTKNDKSIKVSGKTEADMKKSCKAQKGTWEEKKKEQASGGGGGW